MELEFGDGLCLGMLVGLIFTSLWRRECYRLAAELKQLKRGEVEGE